MNDLARIFTNIIERLEKTQSTVWKNDSHFAKIQLLQADKRGQAGEEFIVCMLEKLGYTVQHTSRTDPQNKQWDLVVDNLHTWEIKTATVGRTGRNFQHENIYRERDYHGIIFLDVTPDNLYVTFMPKHLINWKKLHRRKDSVFHKWDFTLSRLQNKRIDSLEDFAKSYKAVTEEINRYLATRQNPHAI